MKPFLFCMWSLVLFSGCLRRTGRNERCQWPTEAGRSLNLRRAADQDHLRDDAQFAEDLAVRYADRSRGKDAFAQFRQRFAECREGLFPKIAALHSVDIQAVSQAAIQRNKIADFVLVYLPVAIFFVLFTYRQCGRIFLTTDSILSAVIAALVTSIPVSGCGVLIGDFWAIGVETIRIGNGHLSFRTGRISWSHERIYLFIIGLAVYWAVAAVRYVCIGNQARDPFSISYRSLLGLNQ